MKIDKFSTRMATLASLMEVKISSDNLNQKEKELLAFGVCLGVFEMDDLTEQEKKKGIYGLELIFKGKEESMSKNIKNALNVILNAKKVLNTDTPRTKIPENS